MVSPNLGDPGADIGGKGKTERAEKHGAKKSKEQREEPLGTRSYQTSSRRSLLFFAPFFSACLVFPSPPLSAPGSLRMGEPWDSIVKSHESQLKNESKIENAWLLCNQTVNLKTDSRTL